MSQVMPAIRSYLFFSILFGLAYPLAMTGISQMFFPHQAGGSLIEQNGKIVGSRLIAQKFESPRYFWSRPSAIDYNPQPSGGSNWGPISADLKKQVDERAVKLKAAHGNAEIPQDLLFASASGLDPQISPEAAFYQASRVAQVRGSNPNQIHQLIEGQVRGRQFGFLGEPTVNVLELNLALDREFSGAK
jgi:K+-transporting ATPase ATPase C chain